MKIKKYDRNKADEYAKKWAYMRNPKYYNYDELKQKLLLHPRAGQGSAQSFIMRSSFIKQTQSLHLPLNILTKSL